MLTIRRCCPYILCARSSQEGMRMVRIAHIEGVIVKIEAEIDCVCRCDVAGLGRDSGVIEAGTGTGLRKLLGG